MAATPAWQWNELQQVGTDYTDVAEVERYEARMGAFRDLAAEDAAILAALNLPVGARILEIGTGSGHFARAAAQAGYQVTALDVSPPMLQYAAARAEAAGLRNIEFRQAGFLTFTAPPATFDAAVSVVVLHHLPDLWKAVALQNVHRLLRAGGKLFLGDVVFATQDSELPAQFAAFVAAMPEAIRAGASGHIAKEYSTLAWIMEGLLQRAGFHLDDVDTARAPLIQYLCTA